MRIDGWWCASIFVMASSLACSSSPPPSCEATVRHIAKLRADLDVPENVAKCLREKWTSTARACVVRASSTKDVTSCMTGRENPDPQPAAAGTASGGRAPAAAGTASGGRAPAAGAPNGGPFGSVKEATLQLATIEQGNLLQFAENGQFVVGAAALTPSAPCCSFPGHRCPAEAKDWVGVRAWEMLGFEMTKSFAFRYSYKGDGKTYEARAVGDLDCDGKTITYVLRGSAAGGGTATLTAPTNAD